jgi:hypothetical protein
MGSTLLHEAAASTAVAAIAKRQIITPGRHHEDFLGQN